MTDPTPRLVSRLPSGLVRAPGAGKRRIGGLVPILLAFVALLAAAPATAQEAPDLPPNANTLTANPFLLLFEWFNAEWEHRVAPNRTLGLQGSHFSVGDADYTSASALVRVYPQERAPSGFFLGAKLGGHYVQEDEVVAGSDDEFAVGFGVEVGYTWLFGSEQDFVLSIGAGVTRLFSDAGEGFLPGIRLVNVGWAF